MGVCRFSWCCCHDSVAASVAVVAVFEVDWIEFGALNLICRRLLTVAAYHFIVELAVTMVLNSCSRSVAGLAGGASCCSGAVVGAYCCYTYYLYCLR